MLTLRLYTAANPPEFTQLLCYVRGQLASATSLDRPASPRQAGFDIRGFLRGKQRVPYAVHSTPRRGDLSNLALQTDAAILGVPSQCSGLIWATCSSQAKRTGQLHYLRGPICIADGSPAGRFVSGCPRAPPPRLRFGLGGPTKPVPVWRSWLSNFVPGAWTARMHEPVRLTEAERER